VFSYVIPFLLLFAVVYAILDKSGILGDNNAIKSIVGVSVGLLALQFDFVSEFFAIIFPRFGVGLSIFLVILITLGFFVKKGEEPGWTVKWIGWVVGIGVIIWSLSAWDQWGYYTGFGGWFAQNVWALIILGGLVALIIVMARGSKGSGGGVKAPKPV